MNTVLELKTANDPAQALVSCLQKLLTEKAVDLVMAPGYNPHSALPMPTLFADPAAMSSADILTPAAPFNAARQAASLIRQPAGKQLALVLRPCEIRALIELTKLNQCSLDNALIIGLDCLGRIENKILKTLQTDQENFSLRFWQNPDLQRHITKTCASCVQFIPINSDIRVHLIGYDLSTAIGLSSGTEKGLATLKHIDPSVTAENTSAAIEIEQLRQQRLQRREALMQETEEKLGVMEDFQAMIADCLNCYNCRTACPVCYCKECVFLTDVFRHPPEIIFRRCQKNSLLKLPPDTTLFHITRMTHIGHACVECGHCSSVCPSDIPVADMFRAVSARVQEAYHYQPGADVAEPIPTLCFDTELP